VPERRWQALYTETNGSPLALVHTLGLMRVRATLTFDGALAMLHGSRDADLQKFVFAEASKELEPSEIAVLRALSFFIPSASFEALTTVADILPTVLESALERLSALSLVDILEGEERCGLHPLTRRFVNKELLNDPNEEQRIRVRFAYYWLEYASHYQKRPKGGYELLDPIRVEGENLDAAAKCLMGLSEWYDTNEEADKGKRMLNLASKLWDLLSSRDYWQKNAQVIESN
jgi:hypothetical protein